MSGDNGFYCYSSSDKKIPIDTKRSTVLISLLLYPLLALSGITYLGKSTFNLFRQSRSVFLQSLLSLWNLKIMKDTLRLLSFQHVALRCDNVRRSANS
jgi:hypothetical protein